MICNKGRGMDGLVMIITLKLGVKVQECVAVEKKCGDDLHDIEKTINNFPMVVQTCNDLEVRCEVPNILCPLAVLLNVDECHSATSSK